MGCNFWDGNDPDPDPVPGSDYCVCTKKFSIWRYTEDGRRRRGRPKKTWRTTLEEDLARTNITWEEAEHTASGVKLLLSMVPIGTGATETKTTLNSCVRR